MCGEIDTAIKYASNALANYRKLYKAQKNRIEFVRMLTLIADCYLQLGEHQSALQYYREAVTENQGNEANAQRIQQIILNLEAMRV